MRAKKFARNKYKPGDFVLREYRPVVEGTPPKSTFKYNEMWKITSVAGDRQYIAERVFPATPKREQLLEERDIKRFVSEFTHAAKYFQK